MKLLKNRKILAALLTVLLVAVSFYKWNNDRQDFYQITYQKTDIISVVNKKHLTWDDYNTIFAQTGVSPFAAKEMVENGQIMTLIELNNLYFRKPEINKKFIAYPITVGERNATQHTPLVRLKKGDILVTFNTHTLGWRHGHSAIVLDNGEMILEHMSIGKKSCISSANKWETYPGFAVLRYPDENIAAQAAEYAKNHLLGLDYNILAGVIKKDKSDEDIPSSSHCSHVVWQAYKTCGVDIDATGGIFVTPENLALSDKLRVVQIYGLNPKQYKDRVLR